LTITCLIASLKVAADAVSRGVATSSLTSDGLIEGSAMLCVDPFVLDPEQGEQFALGPLSVLSRILGNQTDGSFELYDLTMGMAAVDPHVHRRMDETVFVLEGAVDFLIGGEILRHRPGSVAFIPRGVVHGFANPGPERARVLIQFSPAGDQHEYFRELERLLRAPELDHQLLRQLQIDYDQELAVF
jgi:mannose-6-phosphate isomerase-like protein (cupin superfamily)